MLCAVACGGDDEEPRQPLAPPPVNPNLTVLKQGTLPLSVPSDSVHIPNLRDLEGSPRLSEDCASIVLLFTYRTEGNNELKVVKYGQPPGEPADVVEGAEGTASVPWCDQVGFMNEGKNTVTGEMKFVIARTR